MFQPLQCWLGVLPPLPLLPLVQRLLARMLLEPTKLRPPPLICRHALRCLLPLIPQPWVLLLNHMPPILSILLSLPPLPLPPLLLPRLPP